MSPYVIILLFIILLASIPLLVRRLAVRSISRIKNLTRFNDDGVSLAKPVSVEFGVLRVRGYYSRGYHVATEFLRKGSAVVDVISYEDLCSDAYLLAVDASGVGYLIAPAAKITSREGKNVVITCLDPSKTPRLNKSIEVTESQTIMKSSVDLINGRYLIKGSWVIGSAGQWRVVYDEKKGVYTITTEPEVENRVRGAVIKLCVKPQMTFASEFCAKVAEVRKLNEEVTRELEGLRRREIIIDHLNTIDLRKLIKTLGITKYPHISGYAKEAIKVKLVLDKALKRDIVKEEVI